MTQQPFAYVIHRDYDYRYADASDYVFPTLEKAVKTLIEEKCPVSLARGDSPIYAIYATDTCESLANQVDLTAFTHDAEIPADQIHAISTRVTEAIAASKRHYDEQVAALKPGERLMRFSGDRRLFEIGYDAVMQAELRKVSLQWRPL